jgi:hypothetical protein
MKKSIFWVAASAVVLLSSCEGCKEKGPIINFGGSASTGDTTYVLSAPEATSPKKILIEEFTGAKCSNCPAARDVLSGIDAQYPNRLVKLELHPKEHPLGGPVKDLGKYDFRNQSVSDILTTFYGGAFTTGIPIAGIDRIPYKGSRLIDKADWPGFIDERLKIASSANIKLTNSYNAATGEGTVRVRVSYTKAITGKQYISLAITESNIVDAQDYPTRIDTFYNFKHVLRKLVTPASGAEIMAAIPTKEAGRVFEGNFSYKIDAAWKAENCELVVFLHNNLGEEKEVLQAEEVKVKTP